MKNKITGLIAAPSTPMNKDGSINPKIIPQYAKHLRDSGVSGVFVNGSTGESLSLSFEERIILAEAWAAECGPKFKLIVHVGDNSLPVARKLAAHAEKIGAAATGAIPPSFFKPGLKQAAEWSAELCSAAPSLPFYYYHMPAMSGVNIRIANLFPLVKDIDNFAGAKYTFEDMMDFQIGLEMDNGRFDVLMGRDEMLLSALVVGAKGAVGSTYNYMAPAYVRIFEAYAKGNLSTARKWQAYAHKLVQILQVAPNGLACGKAILTLCGVDVGPTRLPLYKYTKADMKALEKSLTEIGFFDWKDGKEPRK